MATGLRHLGWLLAAACVGCGAAEEAPPQASPGEDAGARADGSAGGDATAPDDAAPRPDAGSTDASQPDSAQGKPDAAASPRVVLTAVDDATTMYATFQSHNQKVVTNRHGIFITYLHSYDSPDGSDAKTRATWRLARSTDGGKTFRTLFERVYATKAPTLDTDGEDLYLIHPDWVTGDAYFYRFSAASNFTSPAVSTIRGGTAGKYAAIYDPTRKLVHYLTWSTLFAVQTNGTVAYSSPFYKPGDHAAPHYPHLAMTPDGILFAAWTTTANGDGHYYDVRYLASWDGGRSWGRPEPGKMVTLPVVGDDTGPSVGITLASEVSTTKERWNWLGAFAYKDWKLHFMYAGGQVPTWSTSYVRYNWDWRDPKIDARVAPTVRGETTAVNSMDGFFAHDGKVGSPLYLVSRSPDQRITVLSSRDNGTSWHDFAKSEYQAPAGRSVYAIGGARTVTPDGLLGTFTEQSSGSQHKVYFLRVEL